MIIFPEGFYPTLKIKLRQSEWIPQILDNLLASGNYTLERWPHMNGKYLMYRLSQQKNEKVLRNSVFHAHYGKVFIISHSGVLQEEDRVFFQDYVNNVLEKGKRPID